MRVKEWHMVKVNGRPAYHELEPVYYRKDKTNVRIDNVWYCKECNNFADMERLERRGRERRRGINLVPTSMYGKKVLEVKYRLLGGAASDIDSVDRRLGEVSDSSVPDKVKKKPVNIVIRKVEEKYPGTARNSPCPCGSGKKYKRCCGVNTK